MKLRKPLLAAAVLSLGMHAATASAAAFELPAQPLDQALGEFARQAGLQLLASPSLTQGLQGRPVARTTSVSGALAQLLAGTGLRGRVEGDTLIIERAGGETVLEVVSVTAQGLGGAHDASPIATRSYGASKTDTAIVEIPQSVSVVTRQQMDQMGAQSVEQSVGYLAGVGTGIYGKDSRVDEIWVRGFRTGSFANNMYVDGLRPPGSSAGAAALSTRFDSYGLERVEVLRGPSSVLYGQVTPGGLVNIRSKRPPQEAQRQVGLQTDSEGLIRANVDIGGPIDEERTWLYRLVSSASRTDTEVDHVELKRVFFNPSLTWQPSARTSVTMLVNYQRDRGGATWQRLPVVGTYLDSPYGKVPRSFFQGEPDFDRYDRDQIAIGYSLEQFIGESVKLRQNVRYIEVDMNYDSVARRTLGADGRTLTGNAESHENHSKGFSADTNLLYALETGAVAHMLLGGFDYQKTDIELASATGTVGPLDLYAPVYGSPVVIGERTPNSESGRIQSGVYLQDQMFWNNWTLTAGLRHDWARTRTVALRSNTRTSESTEATTGRIGVTYLFDSGVAPYASYSTSFVPSSGEDYHGKAFDPVEGRQIELGIKYQPPGSRNLVTASLYEITQSNILTPDPDPTHTCNGGLCRVQTGEGRVRGFELEGSYALTRTLSISASYTYMDTEVTESNSTDLGKRLAHVPKEMMAARFDWRAARGLSLGMGARYTGSSYGDNANTLKNASRTLVDASLRYDLAELDASLRGLHLNVNASNLFDKEYVTCNSLTSFCFYGAGRLVSATLSYDW
ncbi:TonB-dependent siderophore receptor [Pseudothauera nasutitermitis]|uniref:TonB-dependent siderophore receptor n=1 Tax=Pseudothauera nasutitermitis TaxID=2565930 RepID=A0A4S4B3T1_9RHOO|nr:TonB-dependent siderophore receptor [Pseudothauera nasutitermitis]THF67322.1 TonB-dependent siderophore receptor [Pseudothauera nasutitermitis]